MRRTAGRAWPKNAADALDKIALKSDGKKLTGSVDVVHQYGKEGTHILKLRLEGDVTASGLSLRVVEGAVTGTWNSGFPVKLQGKVEIKIEAGP